jgi:87kDa Transposase
LFAGVTVETPFFHHPMGDKIHVFSDAPHLIKLLRNHFIDDGFKLNAETTVNSSLLEVLFSRLPPESSALYKYSARKHLECQGNERMTVSTATQLFSHTIATALRRYIDTPESQDLAAFIDLVNSWFDIMNSRTTEGQFFKKPYMNLEWQNEILDKMYRTIEKLRCQGKHKSRNALLPFQNGILRSITSLRNLYADLFNKYEINYLLTYKLNQDALESFFGQIREKGGVYDHPSPMSALYRVRLIILGKVPVQPKQNTNVLADPDTQHNEEYVVGKIFKKTDTKIPSDIFEDLLQNDPDSSLTSGTFTSGSHVSYDSFIKNDGIEYIAGFIGKKYSSEFTETVGTVSAELGESEQQSSWVHQLSRGGLFVPTEEFLDKCKRLEKKFNHYHGVEFKTKTRILTGLVEKLKKKISNEDIEHLLIEKFIRMRVFFKIRALNQKIKDEGKNAFKTWLRKKKRGEIKKQQQLKNSATEKYAPKMKKLKKLMN